MRQRSLAPARVALSRLPLLAVLVAHATMLGAQGAFEAFEGGLARRAALGFRVNARGPGAYHDAQELEVVAVDSVAPAFAAGVRAGDVVVAVEGRAHPLAFRTEEALRAIRGGQTATLRLRREGRELEVRFSPPAERLEGIPGVHTTYGVLRRADGSRLRTLFTRPVGATGRLPAVLLADWTSCDGTEVPVQVQRGWVNLVRGIIQAPGLMVLRVDKPGTGDSEGSCADLDFDETVTYLRQALRQLQSRADVDSTRIFVFGESVGAYMAPLVAQGQHVAGVFAFGGVSPSWFERMLVFERRQRALGGRPVDAGPAGPQRIAHFLHQYLTSTDPLDSLLAREPALRDVWSNEISFRSESRHYGRPISFHRQAQRHDFVSAFIAAQAPTLLLMGEWDQFESVEATRDVVRLINRRSPGQAELRVYPRMNHQVEFHESAEEAMTGRNRRGIGADEVLADILTWMRARH